MTRDELVNALIDWDLGPCSEAASMLQRDGEAIAALEAERDRLASRLKVVTTAISNAAEHQNYSAGSPYDTGWQDAVRWIKQYLHNATLKENNDASV